MAASITFRLTPTSMPTSMIFEKLERLHYCTVKLVTVLPYKRKSSLDCLLYFPELTSQGKSYVWLLDKILFLSFYYPVGRTRHLFGRPDWLETFSGRP